MGAHFGKRERDRIAIVAEILEMARDGMLKSNIMWKARLSYDMLNRYLGLMTSSRLLDSSLVNGRIGLRSTDRGMKFLYHCREIIGLLEAEDDASSTSRWSYLLPHSNNLSQITNLNYRRLPRTTVSS